MAKSRKRVFPKAPVRFHSGLAKELGKNSNKAGYEASVKAIYNQPEKIPAKVELTLRQERDLFLLRRQQNKQ